jgi:predicted dehydrogenase
MSSGTTRDTGLLRVGVVGVGHLVSLHARMLCQLSGVTLGAVFDTDPEKARAVAAQCGSVAAETLDELLDRVDAVTVATDTRAHFTVASRALEKGKHVFLEKPIAGTIQEADDLCDAARDRRLVLQIGHIERFNPAIVALEPYQIEPMFVESHRLAQFNPRGTDVGVVHDLMIHDIDLILSFVHSSVSRVEANGVAVVSDSVDIANARLQFDNGCVANVTASRISQRKMRKMRLFQRNGYISIDFLEGLAEVFRLVGPDEPNSKGTMMLGEIGSGKHKRTIVYEQPKVKEINPLQYELELFMQSVRTGSRPLVSGEDGRNALEVAHIIMKKIDEQTVSL